MSKVANDKFAAIIAKIMSSHEFLPPYLDPNLELGYAPTPCLREQIAEAEARYSVDEGLSPGYPVIGLMVRVDVRVDEAAGERAFSCWTSGCMAYCVVAICLDEDEPFSVRDPEQLQQCAKNTTNHLGEQS